MCVLIFTHTRTHIHVCTHAHTESSQRFFLTAFTKQIDCCSGNQSRCTVSHPHTFCGVEGGLASKQVNKRRVGAGVRQRQRGASGRRRSPSISKLKQKGHVSGTQPVSTSKDTVSPEPYSLISKASSRHPSALDTVPCSHTRAHTHVYLARCPLAHMHMLTHVHTHVHTHTST